MTNETLRKVIVTPHALQQFVKRNPELAERPPAHVIRRIADEVRVAIAEGRIQNHKINGFVLYGSKRKQLPEKQRFVWSQDEQNGWIIARERAEDVVVTSLSRAGVRR